MVNQESDSSIEDMDESCGVGNCENSIDKHSNGADACNDILLQSLVYKIIEAQSLIAARQTD